MSFPNLGNDGCKATYLCRANLSADHVPLAIRSECVSAINDLILGIPEPLVARNQNHAMEQACAAVQGFNFDMQEAHRGDLGGFSTQAADVAGPDLTRGVR